MEKVISTQLTKYLENNNLLNESQYAYRNNSSTEQALVNVTEQIYKSIDKGKISLLVLLDLSKAFDSVNHYLLLNKLVQLKIDGTWFATLLKFKECLLWIKVDQGSHLRDWQIFQPWFWLLSPYLDLE